MDPVIRHGVQTGGLVLGMTPEWRESLNHEKGKIGAMLDKWKVTEGYPGEGPRPVRSTGQLPIREALPGPAIHGLYHRVQEFYEEVPECRPG